MTRFDPFRKAICAGGQLPIHQEDGFLFIRHVKFRVQVSVRAKFVTITNFRRRTLEPLQRTERFRVRINQERNRRQVRFVEQIEERHNQHQEQNPSDVLVLRHPVPVALGFQFGMGSPSMAQSLRRDLVLATLSTGSHHAERRVRVDRCGDSVLVHDVVVGRNVRSHHPTRQRHRKRRSPLPVLVGLDQESTRLEILSAVLDLRTRHFEPRQGEALTLRRNE